MIPMQSIQTQNVPLKMVGGNEFGRFEKMSSEQTFNMIISDGYLVPFCGYFPIAIINTKGQGRGILSSEKSNRIFFVIDSDVYSYDSSGSYEIIGTLETFEGSVSIEENNINQIIFSDYQNLYVYNTVTGVFKTVTSDELGFTPGYVTFQNGRFITGDIKSNSWRLSSDTDGSSFPFDAQHVASIETKPTLFKGALRFPGKGNGLLVFGGTVSELWQDTGATLFPYQRNQSVNIDYGLINPSTLAGIQDFVCWVGINEQAGPAIMYSGGSSIQKISTDGIDYRLSQLSYPEDCFAFMVRLAGHLCYVVTWYQDNITYLYDFNTKKFFTLTDENMNAFIVKQVAFFNNEYYFVNIRNGNLYQMKSDYFLYTYEESVDFEIPMIRVTPSIKQDTQDYFTTNATSFTIQQGTFNFTSSDTDFIPRVDLSISVDGGVNYSNYVSMMLRPQGVRKNKAIYYNLGTQNDLVQQFRFHAMNGPFVVTDGITEIY